MWQDSSYDGAPAVRPQAEELNVAALGATTEDPPGGKRKSPGSVASGAIRLP
jgi:hypothetical protein